MEAIEKNLPKFKSSKVNFNLSLHDPSEQGERYLRSLVYMMAEQMTDDMFASLKRIYGRNKGHPLGIIYKGEIVCLDYLQAVFEMDFIQKHISTKRHGALHGKHILEIGAGYGRTCHTIMSNHNVESYTIADLGNCLALSYRYLSEVLPKEQFVKIRFVPVEEKSLSCDFDLCVCIDAFSELDEDQADQYVKYVDAHCKWFYLKTQLCQYEVSVADPKNNRMIKLRLNKSFDEINVLDTEDINGQVPKFVNGYLPGPEWKCLANSNAKPYMHYWQAMYKNEH
jgi:putative sugar O-methyltransferase